MDDEVGPWADHRNAVGSPGNVHIVEYAEVLCYIWMGGYLGWYILHPSMHVCMCVYYTIATCMLSSLLSSLIHDSFFLPSISSKQLLIMS